MAELNEHRTFPESGDTWTLRTNGSRSLAARLPRQRPPGDAAGGRWRTGQPSRRAPTPDGSALRSRRRSRGGAPRAAPLLERPAPLLRWPTAPSRRSVRLPADPRSPPRPRDHPAQLDYHRRGNGLRRGHPGRAPAGAESGDGHPLGHRRPPRHPGCQRPVHHVPNRRPARGGRRRARRDDPVHRPYPAARHTRVPRRQLRAQPRPAGAGRWLYPAPHHRPCRWRDRHNYLGWWLPTAATPPRTPPTPPSPSWVAPAHLVPRRCSTATWPPGPTCGGPISWWRATRRCNASSAPGCSGCSPAPAPTCRPVSHPWASPASATTATSSGMPIPGCTHRC